jgi:DNA-binding NarL/FixJ family response regulator
MYHQQPNWNKPFHKCGRTAEEKDDMPIRTSIVEDHKVTRASLAALIRRSAGFHLVADYPDAETAVKDIPHRKPDVVLMDINLPGMDGVECVRRLKPLVPNVQFLMLTMFEDCGSLFDSLKAGASGYLLKRSVPTRLLDAIRDVGSGYSPINPQLARRVVQYFSASPEVQPRVAGLTPAEREFLEQFARGYACEEIADQMKLSSDTVRTRVRAVYEKLQVHSWFRTIALTPTP